MNIGTLIYFYTDDCEICKTMDPELKKLEDRYDNEIMKVNVEEGEDERALFDELALDECGGVPFLYNQENQKFICGFATAEQIEDILD
jgi:thiol-disulfide isomerase/thioredoxin